MTNFNIMSLGKIIIVEDDSLSARLLQRNAEKLDYEVVGNFSNPQEALECYKENDVDAVLLDFQLGDEWDGSELNARIQEIRPVTVIFITSADDDESLQKILTANPDGYIQKPINSRELRAILQMAIYKTKQEKALTELNETLDEKVIERTRELDVAVTSLVKEMAEKEKVQLKLERALEAEKEFSQLKSSIVSNLSHEFKTPLASIRSSAQLIKAIGDKEGRPKEQKHAHRIEKAVDSLTDILMRILLVEKDQDAVYSAEIMTFNLAEFMKGLLQESQFDKVDNVSIAYEEQLTGVEISSDKRLLKQIFINLISNACKYSHPNGTVYLTLNIENGSLIFMVKDEGIGMSSETQQQMFHRFFRGDNVGSIEGTGIGMSIVRRCLDALRGEVNVDSTEGKGTTVTISIPIEG